MLYTYKLNLCSRLLILMYTLFKRTNSTGSTSTNSAHSLHAHHHKSRQQKQDQRAHLEQMAHYTSATRQVENLICTNRESLIGELVCFGLLIISVLYMSVLRITLRGYDG